MDTSHITADFDLCYRAICSRDARFDGVFFTAVTTTGIYCRPICPARTPKAEHVRFYACAAAAEAAGFRACRRCHPEASPGSPEWNVRADLVARALRLIADGVVDAVGVAGLADRLAVSPRHLHRELVQEVGVGPLALARTRRTQTARLLIDQTDLSLTTIALAAGFASLRQFNDTIGKERCLLHIHPTDATHFGLVDGEMVLLSTRAGTVLVSLEVTDAIMPGVVSLPHGWGHTLPGMQMQTATEHAGVNVNILTDEAGRDPLSGTAILNGIPVTLHKAE